MLSEIVVSSSYSTFTPLSPLDGRPNLAIPLSDEPAVELAYERAREALPSWQSTPLSRRIQIIKRFHSLLLDHAEELKDVVQWENGKSRDNANDEVLYMAIVARYYTRTARKLLRPQKRRGAFPLVTRVVEHRHPKGVVSLLSPWNYPLCLGIADAIPALLAGNTIVWKPDLQTMFSALYPLQLLHEAGLPKDVIQVVAGEGPVVGPMLSGRGDFVMFTGSGRVGKEVAARAGERLVGCSLELGGKNACIVLPDADLARAAEIAVRGAFANAGQLCIGTERVVVHESVAAAFEREFVKQVEALRIGSHVGYGFDIGPLISDNQLRRVEEQLADAVAKGAKVLTGGKRLPDVGPLCFAPTVLAEVTPEMTLCRNETFGPICSIYTWRDEEELVGFVNDTGLGLSAAIVTKSSSAARRIAAKLKAGGVSINDPFSASFTSVDAPMGGMADSGLGRRHGAEGLLKYTEGQTVASQHLIKLGAQFGLDHEQWAKLSNRLMRVLMRLGVK